MYIVQCTLYIVQYTLYSVQCTTAHNVTKVEMLQISDNINCELIKKKPFMLGDRQYRIIVSLVLLIQLSIILLYLVFTYTMYIYHYPYTIYIYIQQCREWRYVFSPITIVMLYNYNIFTYLAYITAITATCMA